MKTKTNYMKMVLRNAPRYLSGSAFAALAGLLMIKYYTAVLDVAQFGVLALYLVMFKYITVIISLNMDSGSSRLYFDYRESAADEYLSTIFWFITGLAITGVVIAIGVMPFVADWISPGTRGTYLVTLFAGVAAVYVSYLMRVLYNENRSKEVLAHTISQTILNHLSSFFLMSLVGLGVLGRLLGQAIAYTFNAISIFKGIKKEPIFKLKCVFNWGMAKETLYLSLPGMITTLQGLLFVFLDRILIKHYHGESEVGLYALGYMLGQGMSMMYEAVSMAIFPGAMTGLKKDYETEKQQLEQFSVKYYLGLIAISIILSFASEYIVLIFSNQEYSEAATVMPFIIAGFLMGGFYKIPSIMLGFHKKVWLYPFVSFVSFGINAILNILLIPDYGIIGAAFASFIGLFLYSLFLQLFCFKYMSNFYKKCTAIIYSVIPIAVIGHFLSI